MFRRKRPRTQRDMIVLGGWLFADLLLGLAMLFFAANTVGEPPPPPTPTATPNLLATANAQATQAVASLNVTIMNQQTAQALAAQQATATAQALATRAAMTASQRATADAQATQAALSAEATIAAFATQQAQSQQNINAAVRQQATMAAAATQAALAAQATNEALATQGAEVAAIATQNALNGANALATANAQATQVAEIAAIATQNAASGANALATANARAAAAEATQKALAVAAQANSLQSAPADVTFKVSASGVVDGDSAAISDAKQKLHSIFDSYSQCRVAVVYTYGAGSNGDVSSGVQLAKAINSLLKQEFPNLFGANAKVGFQSIADLNHDPGTVEMQVFVYAGCPAAEAAGASSTQAP